MRALHVALIIDGLAGGGAEKVVLTLAAGMQARGVEVTLISLRNEKAYAIPEGIRFIQLEDHYRGPLRRQTEILRRARALRQAITLLPRQPALIISNLPKTDRIVAAARLHSVWYCLHGAVAATQLARRKGLSGWLKRRQLQHTYNGHNLIAVGRGVASDIVECGGVRPARLECIDNPVDLAAVREQSLQPCPMEGEDFIVHVGRFHQVKRHDRLLEAFSRSHYRGKLVLVGKGSTQENQRLEAQCRQLGISERVVFAGFQSNPYPWMRAARALVLSSDHEGFGLVLVEAMACGTPVISTRYHPEGPVDILTDDLAHWIVEPTPQALALAIDALLDHPPALTESHLNRFSTDTVVERYLTLVTSTESWTRP